VHECKRLKWPEGRTNSGVHRNRNVKEQLQLRLMPYNPVIIQFGS